jgi:hypothetical protein
MPPTRPRWLRLKIWPRDCAPRNLTSGQVMVAAVLAALDHLQPADLEPVVAEFHGLVPPATWASGSVDRAGDLDGRSCVRPWVMESALDAIAKIGATECVQACLALHADPSPRGYLTSDKAALARRMRSLLGSK